MRKIIMSAISIFCFIAMSINVSAQSSTKAARKMIEKDKENFQKFSNDNKAMGKATRGTGTASNSYEKKYNIKNNYCTAEDYKVPKKVGLLSFYIDDEEYVSYSSGGGWVTRTSYKANDKKVNIVAQLIYEQSIGTLKESYAKLGMELLTPEEFLITEKQKTMYYDAPLPNLEGKAKVFDLLGSGSAVPEGFRFLPYSSYFIHTGKKFAKEKDQFFNLMEMDALIIVAIKLSAAGGTLKGINTTYFYKNPGYDNSGAVGSAVGYTPYTQTTVNMGFASPMGGIFIKKEEEYTNKKGKTKIKFVKTGVDSNFTKLLNYVVERTGKRVQSQIPFKKKKKK